MGFVFKASIQIFSFRSFDFVIPKGARLGPAGPGRAGAARPEDHDLAKHFRRGFVYLVEDFKKKRKG